MTTTVRFELNGRDVSVEIDDDRATLLTVLREALGERVVKDGCAPQGQCGCCTVLVDGAARVACVTPARRVQGRSVTTPDHVPDAAAWADAFCATGASQCGFCTPGIIARLAALADRRPDADHDAVEQALLAHLCRCTGWQTIVEAWDAFGDRSSPAGRDLSAAAARATLEGGTPQRVDRSVALGDGGFADDRAPAGALVAVLDPAGNWTLGESVAAARAAAGTVQGRRTTEEPAPPIAVPDGRWDVTLQTSWVEPAYLETDASWCEPGGSPASPAGNGGAFGGKCTDTVAGAARRLADEHQRTVRTVFRREDVVRFGPKRPPLAAGIRADGTGIVRVARCEGVAEAITSVAPGLVVEEVDVTGPPVSVALRAAGQAEAMALLVASGAHRGPVRLPGTGAASATVGADGTISVAVDAGDPLDEIVLRSYCIGAAHQAASWVTSESLTVAADGEPHDLTIRSFGILRAVDTPRIEVTITASDDPPVPVSDAVFAAVAGAVWAHQGTPPVWPTGIPLRVRSSRP